MKRLIYRMAGAWIICTLLPISSVLGQTQAKKSLPQVPIIYPADTHETIARRAQLVEDARKEGKLVWWTSIKPNEANQLFAEFNKIYPFIIIEHWRGASEERATRVEADHSAGRVTCDIVDGGDPTNFPRWRKMGLTDKFTNFILDIKGMDKGMYSRYGDWVMAGNNAIVPAYNTNQVPAAEAPKSWEDLLNPKWKGKIGLTTDAKAWYTLALGEGGWGTEKTENYLKKLKQQELVWGREHAMLRSLLIAGEYKIVAEDILRNVLASQDKKAPIDWVKVRPVPITGSCSYLPKKAPHPNAARLFIEWLLSSQGLAFYEKVTGYGAAAPGSGTIISKALEGLPLVYRTEEVLLKTSELGLDKRFAQLLGVEME